MKKIIILLISLFLITGCGKAEEQPVSEYYPLYNENEVKLGVRFSTILATLGEYNNKRESEDTFDDKKSNIYEYDTLEIETYIENNIEKVYAINFTSESQETKEGLCIGDTKEKMIKIYKEEYKQPIDNIYLYTKDNTNLLITTENDIIISIRYYIE